MSYLLNLPVLVNTLFYISPCTVVFILTYIQLKCASSTGINDYLRTYLLAILQIVLVQTTIARQGIECILYPKQQRRPLSFLQYLSLSSIPFPKEHSPFKLRGGGGTVYYKVRLKVAWCTQNYWITDCLGVSHDNTLLTIVNECTYNLKLFQSAMSSFNNKRLLAL